MVKNPPASAGDAGGLGWEDSLEAGMENPRTEEPRGPQSIESQSQTCLKRLGTHARM